MANAASELRDVVAIAPFRRLWTVLGFASFGDWLGLFATAAFAGSLFSDPTAQGLAFSSVIVIRLLPSLFFGPIAGVFADRFDRRYTMVTCDILRFLLIASTPTVYVVTQDIAYTIVWLGIAQVLIELCVMAWMPAKEASIPNLLPKSKLEAANQLSLATTYGIAPPLAFGVLALLSRGSEAGIFDSWGAFSEPMVIALYIDSVMFLISAITVFFFIPEISGRKKTTDTPTQRQSMWQDFKEGMAYMRDHQLVKGLIYGILAAFSGAGILIGVGNTYAVDLGGSAAAFMMLAAVLFVGLGIGIGFGPTLIGALSRPRWFAASIILAGIGLALNSIAPHLIFGFLGSGIIGMGAGMAFLAGLTLLQREVDDEVRGRMFSFIAISARVILMLAMTITAPLAAWGSTWIDLGPVTPSRILLFIAAILVVALGFYSFRKMDDKPGVPLVKDIWNNLTHKETNTPDPVTEPPGLFIVFEGGEGSGKSTQALHLIAWFKQQGYDVVHTREPGGTELGARIRTLLLDTNITDPPGKRTEALLYAADRAHHVETVIRPALAAGKVVISDRYIDSSIAYQGVGRGLGVDKIAKLSAWATDGLAPHVTILLDIDPVTGIQRATGGHVGEGAGDRIEQEDMSFHQAVRETFVAQADKHPGRYVHVDVTNGSIEDIADKIRTAVAGRINREALTKTTDTPWPDLDKPSERSGLTTTNNADAATNTDKVAP